MSTDDRPDLGQLLASVERRLAAAGRSELLAALRSGRSSESVRDLLSAADLTSASSLEQLYGWHDGTRLPADGIVDDSEILPGFYFLSIEDAIAERAANLAAGEWPPSWLPILTNGGGYDFIVDLDGSLEPVVRRWESDEIDCPVAFLSIAALATTIEEGYARHIFVVDERGYLTMDQYQFEAMAAELNPDAAAWQLAEDRASPIFSARATRAEGSG